jgi:Mitochondrial K+-H+ exchange-related
MFTVFLVPAGRDRFELYSEPPEEPRVAPAQDAGRIRQWMHAAQLRWHALVDRARRGEADGALGRWRDALVCHLAESIAEQRTLWALRRQAAALLEYPSTIDERRARRVLRRALAAARLHHGRWLIVDLLLFIASGVLFFVPGPNVVAYYLAFRVVGHFNSWRGARQGIAATAWSLHPDADLGELSSLVDQPREARAPRVEAIAERLNLRRLSAFFDRVAA